MEEGPQPPILASDAERERACTVLREASVDGRLTLDEFSQRIGRALAARTRDQLVEVTRDLPAVLPPQAVRRPPVRWSVAVLGGVERRGFWRVGELSWAVAFMGGCNLDLRGAAISAPVITINAISVMGGVDVIVPPGVEVATAHEGNRPAELAHPPEAPPLHPAQEGDRPAHRRPAHSLRWKYRRQVAGDFRQLVSCAGGQGAADPLRELVKGQAPVHGRLAQD